MDFLFFLFFEFEKLKLRFFHGYSSIIFIARSRPPGNCIRDHHHWTSAYHPSSTSTYVSYITSYPTIQEQCERDFEYLYCVIPIVFTINYYCDQQGRVGFSVACHNVIIIGLMVARMMHFALFRQTS